MKQETRNKKQETRNKKQETRNCYDLLSSCQGECVRETVGCSSNNNGKRLQGIWKLQGKRNNSINLLGFMGKEKHQSNCVYSIYGLCPTLCSSGERMRQYTWILV